jgi:hypothetical protein
MLVTSHSYTTTLVLCTFKWTMCDMCKSWCVDTHGKIFKWPNGKRVKKQFVVCTDVTPVTATGQYFELANAGDTTMLYNDFSALYFYIDYV